MVRVSVDVSTTSLLDPLLGLSGPIIYVVVGVLVFAEAAFFVGFVLPGETAVLLGGVLAATGHVSLPILLAVVVSTAVVGDTVGYEVGRHFGPRLLRLKPLKRHQSKLHRAQRFLRERGGWAVFLGRFTAFLRAVMPALAGTSQMAYPRFLVFNAAGGLLWGVGVTLLGYYAGHSIAAVERALGGTSAALIVVFLLVGVFLWHRSRRRSAAHRTSRRTDE